MDNKYDLKDEKRVIEEKAAPHAGGMLVLLVAIALLVVSLLAFVFGIVVGSIVLLILSVLYWCVGFPILLAGLKVVRPNEAIVLTLFGKYFGTLQGEGFYFVNPFARPVPVPYTASSSTAQAQASEDIKSKTGSGLELASHLPVSNKKLSMKVMTLENGKQKINDSLGNPIVIGIVVIWRVTNTAKAIFAVDNFMDFLSIQCDSALRNIVRLYPYDAKDDDTSEKSLRGSSLEIADKLRDEIAEKVAPAGIEILEARITHLAYAPEIAAAMLQRQQASAIVDARQLIVEGAVGMVEMALEQLNEKDVVNLDEERKAAMVSNLLVVLCGNRDAQPIVNSGSLY